VQLYPTAKSLTTATRTRRFTRGILALPEFLKKNSYRNPTNPTDTAYQLRHDTDKGFFQLLQEEPDTAKQFNNHMSIYAQGRMRWMDPGFYPVQEQLVDGTAIGDQDALLVDMGGSFGHDLSDFRASGPMFLVDSLGPARGRVVGQRPAPVH
jgi:hypothetical protein